MTNALILHQWFIDLLGGNRPEPAMKPTTKSNHPKIGLDPLRAKGWTLRPAAKLLGVHFCHLHHVLHGNRESASLMRRVAALPNRKESAR
jgi:hypothetical protein